MWPRMAKVHPMAVKNECKADGSPIGEEEVDEAQILRDWLVDHDIDFGHRMGIKKLQALKDEAEKALKDADTGTEE